MQNISYLLRHKKRLKRELLDSTGGGGGRLPKKIALLGGSSTAEFKDLLEVSPFKSGDCAQLL
ncbi:hypothetical protein HBZC1_13300 [Helicobacter bizzozeronii CIII-1]|uniref:Uncharacterized protein n=1 Tax=Helicobacter bizzozeronii (strain CIII-1) TaxID=1002804 RepID=F8KQB5_HELBC|nr:hypothetical protein [Helicobacter bizzozeronii]CCB80316.1 hypothetical protein HBZC1_13300 [Helicobacter bizzozeronii CIII-1]